MNSENQTSASCGMCRHAMTMCRMSGEKCSRPTDMQSCPQASLDYVRYPTFAQCLEIYDRCSGAEYLTRMNVRRNVTAGLAFVGGSVDMTTDWMTYERFEELAGFMRDPEKMREFSERSVVSAAPKLGMAYSEHTIRSYVDSFSRVVDKRFRSEFKALGVTQPFLDKPVFGSMPPSDPKGMTNEQSLFVDQLMFDYRGSKNRYKIERFKALFLTRKIGMRPSDVNRLRWSDIVMEDGRWTVVYIPHKTMKMTNRKVRARMSPKLAEMLMAFRPVDPTGGDEYVLHRFKVRGQVRKSGAYADMHLSLWNDLNRIYREHGIEDRSKALYLNRRECGTDMFTTGGPAAEIGLLGHSSRTFEKSYRTSRAVDVA